MSANIATPDSPAGAGSSPSPLFGVWRPVAEYDLQVTDYHPRVLVWDGNRHWTGRYWEEDGKFHCDECMKISATHWMLIPAPPNDKDEGRRTLDLANTNSNL